MKYAVIGMGAVGGYYGSRLALAGHDVHFLLRSDYEHVRAHGFEVVSVLGDYRLDHPNVFLSSSQMPVCDVVFVAMKTTSNHLLPELLRPILGPDTLVVLLQNGIGVEAELQRQLPNLQIAAGIVFINCVKSGPGRLLHRGYGHVTLADYSCRQPGLLSRVAADFSASGVRAEVADYLHARWKKNILNMATNGMTVVHNCLCDALISNPDTCGEVRALMLEGIRAAQACGASGITDDLADKMLATTATTHFATSMKYDYDHHLPMEVEYIYSRPIQEAESHGLSLPHLRRLEQQLLIMNNH